MPKRKRLIRVPFIKPLIGTIDKLEQVGYSKNNKPILMARIQRGNSPISVKYIPLKKNPNKDEIYRAGSTIYSLVLFTYKDNSKYVYLSQGGQFLMIEIATFAAMCKEFDKWFKRSEFAETSSRIR